MPTRAALKPYLDESVAVIMLPGIQYSTGQYLPLEDIVKEAKKHVSSYANQLCGTKRSQVSDL
jgi:kynureninase